MIMVVTGHSDSGTVCQAPTVSSYYVMMSSKKHPNGYELIHGPIVFGVLPTSTIIADSRRRHTERKL